jgi:cell division protein ZapB
MISEFQDLSDKIDRLAAMTASLRRENAELRQINASLGAENAIYMQRLGEVQQRVEALLAKLPALDDAHHPDDEAA